MCALRTFYLAWKVVVIKAVQKGSEVWYQYSKNKML